jgi:regulator of cell morphogenesis and NO signaling
MISVEAKIKEVIAESRSVEEVLSRLHLMPPVTSFHDTIYTASKSKGYNPYFIVEILKAYSDNSEFPTQRLKAFSTSSILQYLKATHAYYLQKKLPEIEMSIQGLIRKFSHSHRDLVILTQLFLIYKEDLIEHILNEEGKLFPYIEKLEKLKQHGRAYINLNDNYSIDRFQKEHQHNEEILSEIRRVIDRHSPSHTIAMPFRIFLIQLDLFEKDLLTHARIEDEILIPRILRLEKEILKI